MQGEVWYVHLFTVPQRAPATPSPSQRYSVISGRLLQEPASLTVCGFQRTAKLGLRFWAAAGMDTDIVPAAPGTRARSRCAIVRIAGMTGLR